MTVTDTQQKHAPRDRDRHNTPGPRIRCHTQEDRPSGVWVRAEHLERYCLLFTKKVFMSSVSFAAKGVQHVKRVLVFMTALQVDDLLFNKNHDKGMKRITTRG